MRGLYSVIDKICEARGHKAEDVLSTRGSLEESITRMMCMAYLHNKMKVPGYKIAEVWGRERTNCLRSIRALRNMASVDKNVRAEWERIKKVMEGN